MSHVLKAARLHLVHPAVILGMPWLIAGISFAINAAIWAVTRLGELPDAFTGGVVSLYVTVGIVFLQSLTQLLPFAMSVSLTRRAFYLGTALVAAVQSLAYALVLTALAAVERATDGWGIGLDFWAPGPIADLNPVLQVLTFAALMLACCAVGMGIGVVQKRWGHAGLWALTIGTLLVTGGLVVLVTWLGVWGSLWRWLTDQSALTLGIGLPAVLAVLLAGLSWPALRRVVP